MRNCCNNGTLQSMIQREKSRKESPLAHFFYKVDDETEEDEQDRIIHL